MNTNITLTQLKRKKRVNGETPVYLQIRNNQKTIYFSTGVKVPPKNWNESGRVVKNHPQAKLMNAKLNAIYNKAESVLLQYGYDVPPETVKEILENGSKITFGYYSKKYRDNLLGERRVSTRKIVWTVTQKFIEVNGDIPLSKISHHHLERLDQHMRDDLGNSRTTRNKNLKVLHTMLKKAIRKGLLFEDPFQKFQMPGENRTGKARLSIDEIEAMEDLELKRGSFMELSRDLFLFSFYLAGIRFCDLCRLSKSHLEGDRIRYQMTKTGIEKNVPLVEQSQKILDRWMTPDHHLLFPVLDHIPADPVKEVNMIGSRNALVNRNLKKVAALAGIKKRVSFHVARHSFADYARKSGMDLYDISKLLAHSSLKVTEAYLDSFDTEEIDNAITGLFK